MKKKTMIIVSIVGITIVLLALIGLTYAYFLTRIQGNTNNKSISLTTADVSVEYYEGNDLVTLDKMMPGDTFTKTFNVKNTGTSEGEYAISLLNVENELEYFKDLTYVIKRNGTTIKEGIFPASDRKIVYKETISSSVNNECTKDNGCINEYELIVTYINRDFDQSIDMNKKVSALVQIENKEDVIEISNESQMKALSRILSYTQVQSSNYKASDDAKLLGIEMTNTNEEIRNIFQNYSYELINDISITYNQTFGDNYFFMIGNNQNPFRGNFYGNDYKLKINTPSTIQLNGLYNSFGLFGEIKNAKIYDLDLELNSSLNIAYNVQAKPIGLLCGKSYNSTFENIDINITSNNYEVNQDSSQTQAYRNHVYLGLLSGELTETNNIDNITFNLNNAKIGTKTEELTDNKQHCLGLIAGNMTNTVNYRNKFNNIKANLINSELYINTEGTQGKIGGLVGHAAYVDITNSKVTLNNSNIKATSTNNANTSYLGLAVGGIVGFAGAGSDNINKTGTVGVNISNTEFISINDNNIEIISAKETTGGGVNAGGIIGLAFNNAIIENCNVNINNGTIIAERTEEGTNEAAYGAHSGGIIGRMEHTGRISSSNVIGNNLNIIASSTEKYNYAGGLAGIVLGPLHRDTIPLENNSIEGNGTTNIYLKLKNNSYQNLNNAIGGLTGATDYIVKDNTINGLNLYLNSLSSSINISKSYMSNYIGDYSGKTCRNGTPDSFTPKTSEIINSKIINTNYGIDDLLKNSITIKDY